MLLAKQQLTERRLNGLMQKQRGKPQLPTFSVDCANGIGAPKLRDLARVIGEGFSVQVTNANIDAADQLNYQVGVALAYMIHIMLLRVHS